MCLLSGLRLGRLISYLYMLITLASQSRIPVERFARIRGCEGRVSATQVLALHISCPDLNLDKLKYSIYFILIIPLFFI